MGCPTEVEIGKNLVFSVPTHDPTTGELTDADAVPDYLVYEDENGTAILSGVMAKLDDDNTTGFYSKSIVTTGFGNGKTYTIYIEATVGGVKGGVSYGFRATTISAEVRRNADLIESQRGTHTWQGDIYYVDPVNGDTHASGNRGGKNDPYNSVQDCHDNAITNSAHDLIILVAGNASEITILTEDVTITKRYLFIRGPGRDFLWTRSGNGDTISIDGADGIELCGFQLETDTDGAGDGINLVDADFLWVHELWINKTRGDGIHILRGSHCQIHNNTFRDTGQSGSGQGIHIVGTSGASDQTIIYDNDFVEVAGHAIQIEQGTSLHTTIKRNRIQHCSGWGINIGASSVEAFIADNRFGNNISGSITDAGTLSVLINNEDIPTALETTIEVWNRILNAANHNISGSSGRRVRQSTSGIILSGTSPNTSGTANTSTRIELNGDASSMDGAYDPAIICICNGTGKGQSRQIFEYDGTNRYAYINRDWKVIPDDTSEYIIIANSGNTHVNEGVARGGDNTHITLNVLAASVDGVYVNQTVFIVAGTGADQARKITAFDGTTKIATVDSPWQINPDTTSIYAMLPEYHADEEGSSPSAIATAVWANATGAAVSTNISRILDVEEGDWRIENEQMIFKNRAGAELFRFNLYDEAGQRSSFSVFKREKV